VATKVTLIWLPRNCSSHKQCSPKAELPHYFKQPANQSRICPPLLITAIVMLRCRVCQYDAWSRIRGADPRAWHALSRAVHGIFPNCISLMNALATTASTMLW
jgi:hypothetical protein